MTFYVGDMPVALSSKAEIRRVSLILTSASAAAALLTGCSGGKAEEKPTTPSSAPASASADPQAAAKAEVATAYRGYWDAQIKAFEKVDVRDTGLESYAFEQAYAKVLADVANMKIKGSAMRGAPEIKAEVTAVSLEETPKKATITDCVDVSKWTLVDAKTGNALELPKERLTRFIVNATARTVDGNWKIIDLQKQDRTC